MRNNQCESRDRGVSLALLVTMVMASGVVRQASAQNVPADSQTANSAATPTNQPAWLNPAQSLTFSYGAFDLHPRLRSTTIYDDNILFAHNGRQQDVISQVAPGIQILGGDRQTLETYLNQAEYWNYNLNLIRLAPSYLIVRPPESWPDKFLLLDYSPQWQQFGKHSENDSLDQFVTANAVWPMAKLILGIQESFSDTLWLPHKMEYTEFSKTWPTILLYDYCSKQLQLSSPHVLSSDFKVKPVKIQNSHKALLDLVEYYLFSTKELSLCHPDLAKKIVEETVSEKELDETLFEALREDPYFKNFTQYHTSGTEAASLYKQSLLIYDEWFKHG